MTSDNIHSIISHKNQYSANGLVSWAIKNKIIFPKSCEICGMDGKDKIGRRLINAHHDDYSKPFNVRWL